MARSNREGPETSELEEEQDHMEQRFMMQMLGASVNEYYEAAQEMEVGISGLPWPSSLFLLLHFSAKAT